LNWSESDKNRNASQNSCKAFRGEIHDRAFDS
jgi:hypothetical protein